MPYYPTGDVLIPEPWSYRNILGRNGGFEVWQRGAGGSALFVIAAATGQYTADGWFAFSAGNTFSVGQDAGLTNGSRSHLYLIRSAGQTSTAPIHLEYPLDTDEIVPMRNSIVTLSFTALRGADYSSAGGTLHCELTVGSGAPARLTGASYTGPTTVINDNPLLTTTAQRFIFTSSVAILANATQASVLFSMSPTGTAGAADFYRIDDMQLEIGSVATPFERRPFESELLACKRHYQKSFPYRIAPVQNAGSESAQASGQTADASSDMFLPGVPLIPSMRAVPTYTLFNPLVANEHVRNLSTNTDCSATMAYIGGENTFNVRCTSPAGSGPGNLLVYHWTADAGI